MSAGIKSLWYPVPRTRVGGQNHSVPFGRTLVAGRRAWFSLIPDLPRCVARKPPRPAWHLPGKGPTGGLSFGWQRANPLLGNHLGGDHPGPFANSTLEGIVLDKGLKGTPSQGFKLLVNGLGWLAEGSVSEGLLGGAKTDEALLRNPQKVRFAEPYRWREKIDFAQSEPTLPGVVGPRTTCSSGKATPDAWAEKARAANLAWVVFLEEFSSLSAENFQKLKADCARLSSPQFEAIPGFTIDDEVGNHYFYFGTSFPYPEATFLTPDGKRFRSRDAELISRQPHIPGQLAMTTLDYA